MRYPIDQIPRVHPMMVRRFTPDKNGWGHFRDKLYMMQREEMQPIMEVEDVGMADSRLSFDADVVDQSGAMLEFTTDLILSKDQTDVLFVFFTSRRWREHRYEKPKADGCDCDAVVHQMPLLFIGNPYYAGIVDGQITVFREPSYLIKSGATLQAEATA